MILSEKELRNYLDRVEKLAIQNEDIFAVFLVGSYAKNTAHDESDIDVMILTQNSEKYFTEMEWINTFGHVKELRTEKWGIVSTIRVFFEAIEIEFNFCDKKWIKIPLDEGTLETLKDGFKIIYERNGVLSDVRKIFI